MEIKQIVESDRKITKELLLQKIVQMAQAKQIQMLFELNFLRDVIDESLKIEQENFDSRSDSKFD